MAAPLTAVRARLLLLPVTCTAAGTTGRPAPPSKSSRPRLLPPGTTRCRCSRPPMEAVAPVSAAAVAALLLLPADAALAVGGELGILEGRSFALLHPLIMGGLFAYTLWAGYLGWQWRRVRTVQDEINALKKQLKPAAAATPAAVGAGADSSSTTTPPPAAASKSPSPAEARIEELTDERKALLKGSFRDRHFNAGSLLLGLGVLESVGGALNTWFRTGKLFPGPHLFAGAAITVLWAAAAALVPAMQKGDETARSLHIALNAVNVLLFVWQIPTGLEIVGKVFEFTTWP
ncbi:hypothetical protein Zm00014a_020218 [Zea mays]|uniref:Uncharacterized protein n=2 Tax=Zea mays TaxID=4577 RepID=B6U6C2_MAIZE|nr:uncharacterized protein LOC100275485 precursor [Zea mays]ACG44905.1 hypothetical protein [Zea mays]AQK60745.1 hypothetical protein ZEAMMB73_Zm00001d053925 [Zea mays]PWZ26770.1 hypothetical protein Zm00014a_020218 [Zea mays]|eukprot:NP_001145083.1 uncharacterized protein LOC100275485 precursor [Zea mays]